MSGASVFQSEQVSLGWQSTGKSCELSLAADDAMAWHEDGNRVLPACRPHRTGGGGPIQRLGEVAIAHAASIRDLLQLPPDLLLEIGPFHGKRNREGRSVAREVFGQFRFSFAEYRMARASLGMGKPDRDGCEVAPEHGHESPIIGHQF
jgi:hypothetical protein